MGAPRNSLVLGKHSGRNALRVRYEQLGFSFERTQLDDVYRRFVALADKIKTIEDGHLLELVRDVPSRTGTVPDSAGKTSATWMAGVSKEDTAHLDPVGRERKGPCGPRRPLQRARRRAGRLSLGRMIVCASAPLLRELHGAAGTWNNRVGTAALGCPVERISTAMLVAG